MTEVPAEKLNRSAVLARTEQQVADDERAQGEARERLARLVTDSPAKAQYQWALGAEKTAKTGAILAEAYFWQGEFVLARLHSYDPVKKTEYIQFADALDRLDEPMCQCRPIQMPGKTAKGVSVPASREIQHVFVGAIEREVKFIYCDRCGKTFAQSV